jgi:hypothetical protein
MANALSADRIHRKRRMDQTQVKETSMREIDDMDLKAEIDQISKKIDAIVQKFEELAPIQKQHACQKQE